MRPTRSCASGRRRDRKSTRLNSSHLVISYAGFCLCWPLDTFTLFPYTTLFRSLVVADRDESRIHTLSQGSTPIFEPGLEAAIRDGLADGSLRFTTELDPPVDAAYTFVCVGSPTRSEEHTSELQSPCNLVCRFLLVLATRHIYPLSLHDALPISGRGRPRRVADPHPESGQHTDLRAGPRSGHPRRARRRFVALHDRAGSPCRCGLHVRVRRDADEIGRAHV